MTGTSITVDGLHALTDRFDSFLIDQFGVLHDGRAPYPGAVEALERLHAAGKRIVLLSNSGKRAELNARRLAKLGFDPASYDLFLTSGETAWRLLKAGDIPIPGPRCLLSSRDGDTSIIDGLGLERVADGASADLVVLAASEADRYPLQHYRDLLAPAAARKVPCLCTNPDREMLVPGGTAFGTGRIAELYQELGGEVRFIGKPYRDIYAEALRYLDHPDPSRVLCIGDSVEHDIGGAHGAGLPSALTRTGVAAGASDGDLAGLYRKFGATPDFLLAGFVW